MQTFSAMFKYYYLMHCRGEHLNDVPIRTSKQCFFVRFLKERPTFVLTVTTECNYSASVGTLYDYYNIQR